MWSAELLNRLVLADFDWMKSQRLDLRGTKEEDLQIMS